MIDKQTTLSEFKKKKIDLQILEDIKSGKEASVFKASVNGKIFALKIYKDNSHMSFNRYHIYREGKFVKSSSQRRAITSKKAFGRRLIESFRTALEFKMLEKFYSQGANVPKEFDFVSNAILMEYLGNENAAPKLKDVLLSRNMYSNVYKNLIQSIQIFWANGIVHGDLSEYNIL